MPFDPSAPFEVVGAESGFDPSKPFEVVEDAAPKRKARIMEKPADYDTLSVIPNTNEGDKIKASLPIGARFKDASGKVYTKLDKISYGGEMLPGTEYYDDPQYHEPGAAGVLAKAGISAPASAAFLTTMGATSRAMQGLQAAGPLGKTAAVVGPIIAGAAAAALESILQRKATEMVAPEINRYEERLSPAENLIGGAIGSGFRPGGFSGPLRQQALERLVPAAAGAGIQGGIEIAQGMPEGAAGRILESAATNALLNKTTAPGQALIGLGAKVAEKAVPSLIARVDAVGGKSPKGLVNTKANEIALGSDDSPENLAGLDRGLRTDQKRVGPKPEVNPPETVDIEGFRKVMEERNNKIVDAITKYADKKYFRESNKEFLDQLSTLGLNAEESAHAFEAAKAAADHATNYAGSPVKKSDLTRGLVFSKGWFWDHDFLGELIGQEVEYAGYKGKLIREQDGGFGLVPKGVGKIVEIAETGKNLDTKISDIGVKSSGPVAPSEPVSNVIDDILLAKPKSPGPGASKPKLPAPASYRGFQDGFDEIPGFHLWDLKEPVTNPVTGITHPIGSTVATNTLEQAGFKVPKIPEPKSGGVVQGNAAPIIGAVIGYQFGDTPEEKRKNALIGAAIGLGGVLGQSLSKTLTHKNRGILDQINRLAVESRAKGQQVWNDYITRMKDSPITEVESLGVNLKTPADQLAEVQDAPSGDTASPSPTYQWTPFFSKTSVGKAVKKVLGTIEGNIFPISPRVGGAIREYGGLIDQMKVEWTERTYPLRQSVRKLLTPEQIKDFDYALWKGDMDTARAMLASKSEDVAVLLDNARATYEKIALAEESVGRTVNRIEGAWPREMVDYEGFRADMEMSEQGALDAAIASAEKQKKRPLSDHERADVLNDAISMTLKGRPSFLKPRTVQGLTRDEFLRHYQPFDVAMDNRIAKASRDVARRKFVGNDSPENTDLWDGRMGGFGEILQQEVAAGKISSKGQKVIVENLKDFLRQDAAAGNAIAELGNKISRAQNILFLGDISTSIAQFGDLFVNVRRYGPISATKGLSEALKGLIGRGKAKIELKDLGLGGDTFAETQHLSRSKDNQGVGGVARRTRDRIITMMVGWADKVNKESTVNAARIEYSKVLTDPTSREYVNLYKKYQERFPERWESMIKDLKSKDFEQGKLTDNTRFFLMNELADIQPISMAQRAQLENSSPSARFLYSLKRYWVKQLDILRQEGYEKFKDPRTRGQGVKNVATYLAIVSAMQGLAIATIRDIMFGREVDLEENALGGVFQTFGVNRYMFENVRQGHLGDAAINFVSPLASVATDTYRDYGSLINNPIGDYPQNSRLLKYLPIVGREAYYLAGAGAAAKEKAEKKKMKSEAAGEVTPSLGALGKLFLPPPPKKKR